MSGLQMLLNADVGLFFGPPFCGLGSTRSPPPNKHISGHPLSLPLLPAGPPKHSSGVHLALTEVVCQTEAQTVAQLRHGAPDPNLPTPLEPPPPSPPNQPPNPHMGDSLLKSCTPTYARKHRRACSFGLYGTPPLRRGAGASEESRLLPNAPPTQALGRANSRREEGVGGVGSGTQRFVYQKWPDQISPFVNFVFSHDGHLGLGGGGGGLAQALVLDCLPLAVPSGLSPLLILTLCGPERVFGCVNGAPG